MGLRHLSELRILHLRQPTHIIYLDESAESTKACTFELQRFANAFFDLLHVNKYCGKLHAIVIGSLNYYHDDTLASARRTQHCFVKGFQVDMMGRKVAVGVPVTRELLRRVEPYTDILDFDPVCGRVGGLPGKYFFA